VMIAPRTVDEHNRRTLAVPFRIDHLLECTMHVVIPFLAPSVSCLVASRVPLRRIGQSILS
jgi:hypothetical protein